jgi:hypothetical protein
MSIIQYYLGQKLNKRNVLTDSRYLELLIKKHVENGYTLNQNDINNVRSIQDHYENNKYKNTTTANYQNLVNKVNESYFILPKNNNRQYIFDVDSDSDDNFNNMAGQVAANNPQFDLKPGYNPYDDDSGSDTDFSNMAGRAASQFPNAFGKAKRHKSTNIVLKTLQSVTFKNALKRHASSCPHVRNLKKAIHVILHSNDL